MTVGAQHARGGPLCSTARWLYPDMSLIVTPQLHYKRNYYSCFESASRLEQSVVHRCPSFSRPSARSHIVFHAPEKSKPAKVFSTQTFDSRRTTYDSDRAGQPADRLTRNSSEENYVDSTASCTSATYPAMSTTRTCRLPVRPTHTTDHYVDQSPQSIQTSKIHVASRMGGFDCTARG